jgi:D-glycero-alpha-D-manno-heptose-7-phosphate kinase
VIVAKVPLRIPLAGGLTDLKDYAQDFGGVTVSTTINRHVYVVLKESYYGFTDLHYQDKHERVDTYDQIRNDLIRESLRLTGLVNTPLQLNVLTDFPGESGLGGSGAITVGLLHAIRTFQGNTITPEQLFTQAAQIEVDILDGASGYHDPTICAIGGFKLIEYHSSEISSRNVTMSEGTRNAFVNTLLLFYSGRHRPSKPSLNLLSSQLPDAHEVLHKIKQLGYALEQAFGAGDLLSIGETIGLQQELKQQLPGHFQDEFVLSVTERVRRAGGYAQIPGGKISAFVIVCCPKGNTEEIRAALPDLQEVRFELETEGSQVRQF